MTRDEIKALHPNLQETFEVTSSPTPEYNCFAWAAGQTHQRWDPDGYFWPPNVPRDWKLSSVISAFQTLHYETCNDGTPEEAKGCLCPTGRAGHPPVSARSVMGLCRFHPSGT